MKQKHIYNILIKRKRNSSLYSAKHFKESDRFQLCTGENMSRENFTRMFHVIKHMTEKDSIDFARNNKVPRIFNNSTAIFKNPINGFKLRLRKDDPRSKFMEMVG